MPEAIKPVLSLETSATGPATKSTEEDNLFEKPSDGAKSSVSDFATNHEGQYQHVDQSSTYREQDKGPPDSGISADSNSDFVEQKDSNYASYNPSSSGTKLKASVLFITLTLIIQQWIKR